MECASGLDHMHWFWPGAAAVLVCVIHMTEGDWSAPRILDGKFVSHIDGGLVGSSEEEDFPELLREADGLAYQGSSLLGMGFVLTPEEAQAILEADPPSAKVIAPYLGGQDINRLPVLCPIAYAINFGEMKEQDAKEFYGAWTHVERTVKPERMEKDPVKYPRLVNEWWKYWHSRRALYERIAGLQRVIVCARVSKRLMLRFCPSDWVFNDKVIVFARETYADFAILQSSFHEDWAWKYGSTLKADLNYVAKSCHGSFPFSVISDELESLGSQYYEFRDLVMKKNNEGLTALYNRFHRPNEISDEIKRLRNLHRQLDACVADAYGWHDLAAAQGEALGYEFYATKRGLRYTISEACSREALRRLLALNKERHEEEDARVLNGVAIKTRVTRERRAHAEAVLQQRMDFGDEQPVRRVATNTSALAIILDYLRSQSGWHSEIDILAVTGIPDGQWNAAINELIDGGTVERKFEKSGTRYRAMARGAHE